MKELILTDKVSDTAGCSTTCSTSTSVGVDLQSAVPQGTAPQKDSSGYMIEDAVYTATPLSQLCERTLIWNILCRAEQVYALTEVITRNDPGLKTYEAQAHLLMCANAVVFDMQGMMEELAVRFGI